VDVTIIGVDCAAQAQNTGLAWAIQHGEKLVVRDARCRHRAADQLHGFRCKQRW
jgi:hypothetical protein